MTFPRILRRKEIALSPWVTVLEKEVAFDSDSRPEVYHSVTQASYVAVLAIQPDGLIPIVRQYRPAVEAYTWEFPAGTVDAGEDPATAARRELLEEIGVRADRLFEIGAYHPDTGRLSVASFGFFATCSSDAGAPVPEPGIEVRRVTLAELFAMVKSGDFRHQLHVALIASALIHGHIAQPGDR